MVDSPHHPEQEVIFALGEAGVIDPESETKTKKAIKVTKKVTKTPESKTVSETPDIDSESD